MRIAAPVEARCHRRAYRTLEVERDFVLPLRALRAGTTAISRHVSSENSALRQLENLATCTQSASGLRSERAANRSESRAHSNSAQRSSTSQPICRSGLARRKAAIAGMP